MILIGGSAGAVAYRLGGLPMAEAAAIGILVFLALGLLEQAAARRRDRKKIAGALVALENRLRGAETDIAMLTSRIVANENNLERHVNDALKPMVADLDAMGAIIQQVSEVIADVDRRLEVAERRAPALPLPALTQESARMMATARPEGEAKEPARRDAGTERLLESVRQSVRADRIDIALQAIVSLPQRRVRGYEAFPKLWLDADGSLDARQALPAAEAAGVGPMMDALVLKRTLTVTRRLLQRNPEIIVFVNVGLESLSDLAFCDTWKALAESAPDLAGHLVVEFRQSDVRQMSPIDHEMLGTIYDLGFRFSVDAVSAVGPGLLETARHGVRFAKVPAGLLLGQDGYEPSDIHPEDLADLLARHGIELIADEIATEGEVVDVLECNPPMGQGYLFAAPRVVKSDPGEDSAPAAPAPARTETPPEMRPDPRSAAERMEAARKQAQKGSTDRPNPGGPLSGGPLSGGRPRSRVA